MMLLLIVFVNSKQLYVCERVNEGKVKGNKDVRVE